MSVLSEVISEREEWANRHRMTMARYGQIRTTVEFGLLLALGLAVYLYHDRMILIIRSLLSSM